MRFYTIVLKNLTRRPFRSCLTMFAVAIAVGAVVALVGISTQFQRSFIRLYENAGIDLIVVRSGLRQRLTSTLDQQMQQEIEQIPGVKEVVPAMVDVVSLDDAGMYGVIVQGCNVEALPYYRVVAGRPFTAEDNKTAMIGRILADNLGKTVGDEIEIYEQERFRIVGVFESKTVFENGSILIALEEIQRILDSPQQVTGFSVVLHRGDDAVPTDLVRRDIEQLTQGINAMPVDEHVNSLEEIRAARVMAWLTSAIALLVGTAGVLNTMIMSVQERTSEIGILRGIGWSKRRIMQMVLSESLALSLLGAAAGTIGAIVLVKVLTQLPATNGAIDGEVPLVVVAQGFVIAVLVGLAGGCWAAWSAARMLPTSALRHE